MSNNDQTSIPETPSSSISQNKTSSRIHNNNNNNDDDDNNLQPRKLDFESGMKIKHYIFNTIYSINILYIQLSMKQ